MKPKYLLAPTACSLSLPQVLQKRNHRQRFCIGGHQVVKPNPWPFCRRICSRGGLWTDMPVAGGGGDAAMTALRARVLSGNAPTAVQLKGPAIQEWYEEGALSDISSVAKKYGWADVLPASIAGHMKCEGKWCAAPVNVHRIDWIWANAKVLADNGIVMPTSWDEFNAAADKLMAKGITPLAHGGQAWQDATVFEAVALGIGGPEFFHKAFVDLDTATLKSSTMVKVFDQMRKLRGYVDSNFSGRDWNLATAMVMNGEAAFQIMGDWAKGEFLSRASALVLISSAHQRLARASSTT